MSPTIEKMRETFRDSFMQPECFSGGAIEYELMESGLDVDIDKFYCRLSASGFLDCTDWHGPFDSVDEAADHLMDMYAGD
jgi:hypothetical protein